MRKMNLDKKYFGKKLSKLKLEDIKSFIEERVEENSELEYKGSKKLYSEKGREDLAKEVTAFANSQGGLLIVGIKEDEAKRYPEQIEWTDYPREGLIDSLNSKIMPPIQNLEINTVEKRGAKAERIFLIYVLGGPNKPYAVSKNDFYKRAGSTSQPMNRDEIVSLIKERKEYEKCALFRHELNSTLEYYLQNLIGSLYPQDYEKIENYRRAFKNFTGENLEDIIDIVRKVGFNNIKKIEFRFFQRLEESFEWIKEYPNEDITPEEKILLKTIESYVKGRPDFKITIWIRDEAEYQGLKRDNEEDIQVVLREILKENEEARRDFKNLLRTDLQTWKLVLKLKEKLDEIQEKYGSFSEYIFDVEQVK